ncbi:hypothetical protein [Bradyrhizobium sp. LHD-71]|uniref:hypothetical protein n=1 Tax=Bradyrhizobium sp. LHD-71 TaxID=3072141 RepID=UPI00280DC0FA|nr:hypothetical protein [Bradyrhizobium sp. LHD-71]MDQ8728555.1 hypothetical protein [Bradyrhizobium sp. LHD-71]
MANALLQSEPYDGIVASGSDRFPWLNRTADGAAARVAAWGFQMMVLLAAGVGVLVMGLLAVGFGIPISDSSFGNALLIAGVVILCTGLILIGMWFVARELVKLGKLMVAHDAHLGRFVASDRPPASAVDESLVERLGGDAVTDHVRVSGSPPWAEPPARSRPRPPMSGVPPIEPVAVPPPPEPDRPIRRNLLFTSKRRERLEALAQQGGAPPSPIAQDAEPRMSSFENAWSRPLRQNSLAERVEPSASPAEATTSDDRSAGASTEPQNEDTPAEAATTSSTDLPPGVTVVRSGSVDEMTYTYYSDGSIEAQLPGEGPIRFASLDALRTYVEQRK